MDGRPQPPLCGRDSLISQNDHLLFSVIETNKSTDAVTLLSREEAEIGSPCPSFQLSGKKKTNNKKQKEENHACRQTPFPDPKHAARTSLNPNPVFCDFSHAFFSRTPREAAQPGGLAPSLGAFVCLNGRAKDGAQLASFQRPLRLASSKQKRTNRRNRNVRNT